MLCRANVAAAFGDFDAWGRVMKKKEEKKIDCVYASTTTRCPKDIPLVRNYDLHAERGSTKRLRGCRRDMAKVLTELSAGSGSITRHESRQNFPAGLTHPRPSRCTERHSRIKTDYIPVSNGGDMFPGRSNLRHPVTTPIRPSLSRPFPRATMCFSSVLMVGELVVVNNIVTVNFA